MTNKELVERYPFLKPRDAHTGLVPEDYDYSYTMLDSMPDGWRVAFGDQMCEEIRNALLAAQKRDPEGGYAEGWYTINYDSDKIIPYLEGYSVIQIKEKYGGLRWYDCGAPKEVEEVINKYENLSTTICINCGMPARVVSYGHALGYIAPYCDECAKEYFEKHLSKGKYNIDDYFTPIVGDQKWTENLF